MPCHKLLAIQSAGKTAEIKHEYLSRAEIRHDQRSFSRVQAEPENLSKGPPQ
jgi:hypothetical protein